VSLLYGAPDGEPRHMRQLTTEPGARPAVPSVAEALRSRFPLTTEAGRRRARISVAEALHSRLVPLPREPIDVVAAAGVPAAGVPAAGVPAAGVPAAGVPAAGVPAAGVPAAGVPAAGVPAAGVPAPRGARGATAGSPSLPRRIRNLSVSARRAQAAAPPELLLRILDGLQRL
jgi:hypothetical protein